jgi:dihydrofolate synthase/folylpolyglutamate synthase
MAAEQASGPAPSESYTETIDWLFGLQRFGIKLGLENMNRMLRAFGNPHQDLKTVHIGGSNGKGSVAAFAAKIYQKAGYKVGLYTSPHLLDFSERIRINGNPISTDDVVRLTREIRAKQREVAGEDETLDSPTSVTCMTFFEFTTLMAFLYFAQSKVDLAIVEVGLGGRLDATNVIKPLVSVITTVGLEHQQYLGKTLVRIAQEKAGIIKPGVTMLTAVSQPHVIAVVRARCEELGTTMVRVRKDIRVRRGREKTFTYYGLSATYRNLTINVSGDYQPINAALAVGITEILKKQGFSVTEAALRAGLKQAAWPGRLEQVQTRPSVILDGAHNVQAIRRLSSELKSNYRYQRLFLVIGIMEDKPIKPILRKLVDLGTRVIFTRPKLDRAASPSRMLSYVNDKREKIEVVEDVKEAVRKAMSWAYHDDLVCVAGSLFAAGEARELFFPGVEL